MLHIHKGYKSSLTLNVTALPSFRTRLTTQGHNREYLNIQSPSLQKFEKSYSHARLGKHCYVNSWFQNFAVIWILYMFFWVFPRRQIVVGRRFGTLCQFHLQRLGVEYTDTGFRNVDQLQFDAGEIPKRTYTICYVNVLSFCNVCLFSWRYNPLWLYFSQPGSGL